MNGCACSLCVFTYTVCYLFLHSRDNNYVSRNNLGQSTVLLYSVSNLVPILYKKLGRSLGSERGIAIVSPHCNGELVAYKIW